MEIEKQLEHFITAIISTYGWYIIAATCLFFMKATIENVIQSFIVFFGRDFDQDDVVIVNGRPGRIIRTGVFSTAFFLYTIENEKVVGGNKLVVQNSELKSLRIEKPLQLLSPDILKGYEDRKENENAKK